MKKNKLIILILSLILGLICQFYVGFQFDLNSNKVIVLEIILFLTNFLILFQAILPSEKNSKKEDNNLFKFETVIKSLNDAVVVVSQNNIIKLFNPEAEKITGYSSQDAIGIDYQSFIKLVNANREPILSSEDPVQNSVKTNQMIKSKNFFIQTYSNNLVPVFIQAVPMNDDLGTTLVTFRNISKELDEEREQLEFISTASHEMRTPIASIEGYSGLSINEKTATIDDRARSCIVKAQDSVKHLGELFRNLLSISRAEDKQLQVNPEVIDTFELLSQLKSDFENSLSANKNLELVFDRNLVSKKSINPKIYVYTDKTILREIISNLIENAIKYTPSGQVTLGVETNANQNAVLWIKDTGVGIPPENIPHLFQKFYRVDNSKTREIGGTGLGLYLARKMTENIKGRIWVNSQLDQGSTFFISLPRVSLQDAEKLDKAKRNTVSPNKKEMSPMSNYFKNQ